MSPFWNADGVLVALAVSSSAVLAMYALKADWRSAAHRLFALGMTALCLETFLGGMASVWGALSDCVQWFHLRNVVSSFVPVIWLLFVLALGTPDLVQRIKERKLVVLSVFLLPFFPAVVFPGLFFRGKPILTEGGHIFIRLGWSGYFFKFAFILGIVTLMVAVENTLRSSRGVKRWQVKFLVLGVLGFFAVRIFTSSQAVLFRMVDLDMEVALPASALIIANFLIAGTFIRTRVLPRDIYLSGEFIRRSLVLFFVGGYLLVTGFLAKVLFLLGQPLSYRLISFTVFVFLVLLAAILFSDRLRLGLKRFVSRHFQRPRYDYRDVWRKFTERTSSAGNIRELGERTVSFMSEMLEVLTVNLWLFRERGDGLELYGSTAVSGISPLEDDLAGQVESLYEQVSRLRRPADLLDGGTGTPELRRFARENVELLEKLGMRYCAPLRVGENLLGFMAIDRRVGTEELNLEDLDLLGTVVEQVAAGVQNLQLSEKLQQAKETQTLRKFSAFFIHDLKNVASKLSMMLQNFSVHYDNPEFRADALTLVSQSVEKINLLTRRMSELREAPELRPQQACLSDVARKSLSEFDLSPDLSLMEEYGSLKEAFFDPDAVARVVTNLVLNAVEALDGKGTVCIRTFDRKGWSILEVSDDGPGMSGEFIAESLFQPFKTTKEKGLGIGLYQCRTLVEAQGGHIDVESKPGEGAVFQVYIPRKAERGEMSGEVSERDRSREHGN